MIDWNALELARDVPATPAGITKLAKQVGEESARWAVQQWELRRKARAKFSDAASMLFTREALEQASHERVAQFHASLFASRLPQLTRIADLTTGIGSDLRALSRSFSCVGYELDPVRAEYARHNSGAEVLVQDSLAAEWNFEAAFADPARRVEGRRTLRIDEFSPDPRELARRIAALELGVIKLTPMLSDEELQSLGSEILFVSYGGECREALVITGKQARQGVFALHVESGSIAPNAHLDLPPPEPQKRSSQVPEEGAWLFEADPALIRAHALDLLIELGLSPLGDSNGYFTCDQPIDGPWVKSYPILYSGKGDWSTTKEELRKLQADRPVLKQRGAGQDLIKLAKTLKPNGTRKVAVVLYTVGKSIRHIIVEI